MAWLIKNKNDSLAHAGIGSHKHIDKYRDRKGNWQYVYEDGNNTSNKPRMVGLGVEEHKRQVAEAERRNKPNYNGGIPDNATQPSKKRKLTYDDVKSSTSKIKDTAAKLYKDAKTAQYEKNWKQNAEMGRLLAEERAAESRLREAQSNVRIAKITSNPNYKNPFEGATSLNGHWPDEDERLYEYAIKRFKDEDKAKEYVDKRSTMHVEKATKKHGVIGDARGYESDLKKAREKDYNARVLSKQESMKVDRQYEKFKKEREENHAKQVAENEKRNKPTYQNGIPDNATNASKARSDSHARQVAEAERRNKPTGIPANATQPVAGDKAKTNAKHLQEVRSNMLRNKPSYDGAPANATRYNKEEHDALAREYNKRKRPAITRR